ncbi:hypothetical protein H5410_001450 [Solanum commersonii]|uniref:Uncharacterized protein n=1 Tax=Solanum commersonii TaxID=4109 RepID=A0A9J6AYT2_SOLCO|nr:hypothetical protein H5410_001450 [Solanum commersonii]
MICDHRLTQIETVNSKGKNIVEENTLTKPFNLDPRQGLMDPPWVTNGRGKENNTRGRGISSPGSSYGSSSNTSLIQMGRSLINSRISQSEGSSSAHSSVHLEDILEGSPLYAQLQAYLSQKENDTFASIAKEDNDDIKSYEKKTLKYREKKNPRRYFQRHLINGLYFLGYNTSENVYNFSKMIIKQIISVEDWGISTMKERHISLNKIAMSFTYWNYIQAFDKVLYYNNKRYKHTWWSYHGPIIKILLDPFFKLYKEWVKVSPDLNELYNANHTCYLEKIDQIYYFIEFFIPWIHKWTPKVGFTEEQIPCLYRTFYNNFWDKLMKKDPKSKTIHEYGITPQKRVIADSSVMHIARKISVQDGDKEAMINNYLEEVKRSLLLNITQYEKSNTSMRSETSEDATDDIEEAQHVKAATSKDTLKMVEDFLRKLNEKDKMYGHLYSKKPSSTVDTLFRGQIGPNNTVQRF